MTWPPPDTDRNRFLARLQLVIYGLVTAYFLLFALVTGALVPWSIFAIFLAATIVVSIALVHMRAQRHTAGTGVPDRDDAAPPARPGAAG